MPKIIQQSSDPILRGGGLNVFKETHEAEIHMEILMAVKQCDPRVIGDKIDISSAEAFDQDGVFENSARFDDKCRGYVLTDQVEPE